MSIPTKPRHRFLGGVDSGPAEPLWKIVPTRDAEGRRLVDFMMLVPRLRTRPRHYIEATAARIHGVLARYDEVVFVDLNLSLNVLWVSLRFRPGIVLEISGAIRLCVPEAVLVAHQSPV